MNKKSSRIGKLRTNKRKNQRRIKMINRSLTVDSSL